MASRTANIHLLDLRRKIESGFSLRNDGFLDGVLLGIFATVILLNLGMNKKP